MKIISSPCRITPLLNTLNVNFIHHTSGAVAFTKATWYKVLWRTCSIEICRRPLIILIIKFDAARLRGAEDDIPFNETTEQILLCKYIKMDWFYLRVSSQRLHGDQAHRLYNRLNTCKGHQTHRFMNDSSSTHESAQHCFNHLFKVRKCAKNLFYMSYGELRRVSSNFGLIWVDGWGIRPCRGRSASLF